MTHRPQLWVIAGPNGAGKSTLVRRHLTGKVPVVNPDDIARELSPHNPSLKNAEAGRLAIKQRAVFLQECRSFAVETTLTGKGEIKLMELAVSAGYKVNFIFVGVHDVGLTGLDMGLSHYAVKSSGDKMANPRHLINAGRNLRRKQKALSRKQKGGANRRKARQRLAAVHERIVK